MYLHFLRVRLKELQSCLRESGTKPHTRPCGAPECKRHARRAPKELPPRSHRHWELAPGRWDDNSPAKMPRACTVRTLHPAHLPCCSTSFAPVGMAHITARLWCCGLSPQGHKLLYVPEAALLISASLLQKQRQHRRALMLNTSAALLCLQVAKIHILFTSMLLMWGNLNLIAKARKSWARLVSNCTLLFPTRSLLLDWCWQGSLRSHVFWHLLFYCSIQFLL